MYKLILLLIPLILLSSCTIDSEDKNTSDSTGEINEITYISVGSLAIESSNHGKPENPKIILNPKTTSDKIPQAWSIDKSNGSETKQSEWYYNYPGAIAEAEYTKKRLPTINEWYSIINESKSVLDIFKFQRVGFLFGTDINKDYKHPRMADSWLLWSATKSPNANYPDMVFAYPISSSDLVHSENLIFSEGKTSSLFGAHALPIRLLK